MTGVAWIGAADTAPPAPAPASTASMAALLYELARFVEWPADCFANASAPFVIGVLGEDPFGGDLEAAVAGKRLKSRAIAVRRFRNLDEVDPCQLLFVGRNKERLLPAVLEFLAASPTLTIGLREGFVEDGGMIRLVERPEHVAFEVNLPAARRARLRLDSELLRLAERIWPERPVNGSS